VGLNVREKNDSVWLSNVGLKFFAYYKMTLQVF